MAARLSPMADELQTRLKHATLWSPTRTAMLNAIHARPGASASEIARAIGRDASTVWNNVHLLSQAGLVRAERDGRCLRLYPSGGLTERTRMLARLGPSADVYEALVNGVPGRPVPIAHACGITRHAARNHLARLVRIGAVQLFTARVLVTERHYRPLEDW